MRFSVALSSVFVVSVAAVAVDKRQLLGAAPTAVIKNGTVIGKKDIFNNVDNFLGIPFAIPPVGTKRLTNPTPLTSKFGTITATTTGSACYGYIQSSPTPTGVAADIAKLEAQIPLFQALSGASEDCLSLNVQRSSGLTSSSKAPVLVYIYGGGFETGSTSQYDGTTFIQKANSLGLPLVYVTMGYRLAALGWLPGKEMQGISNLGLKDQRLALKWIQENIAAFGGDPNRVTIWGESAGAISVFDQMVVEGGDISYNGGSLFKGAIMNSGSAVPALDISAPYNQKIYDQVVAGCNCTGASDTLACMRSVSIDTFNNAQFSLPGIFDYQSLHLAYFPRPDASDKFYPSSPDSIITSGAYPKIPIIISDQEDEGTLFSQVQSNLTTHQDLLNYISTYFPEGNPADIKQLVDSYPDDPVQGSPFRTGALNQLYPQYKQLAAILGDITFTLTRRVYLSYAAAAGVKAWSHLNTYLYNTSPLGTFHGSDILNTRTLPLSYVAQNATQIYYLSFVNYLDPNAIKPSVQWPQWDNTNKQLLNFTSTQILLGKDDFRQQQYQTLKDLSGQGKLRA